MGLMDLLSSIVTLSVKISNSFGPPHVYKNIIENKIKISKPEVDEPSIQFA